MELQTNVKTGEVKINEGTTPEVITKTPEVITKVEPDLVTRVSQVKTEPKPEDKTEPKADNPFNLTREDWDRVQSDPSLKKYYQSMLADYQRKTQDFSEQKHKYEKELNDLKIWTPEKVQNITKDPAFVEAAQKVLQSQNPSNSGLTDDEYSVLSDKDKAQLQSMRDEIQTLKMQNYQERQKQEDEQLKTKYANYNSQALDIITAEVLAGKRNVTREDMHKSIDYEPAIRRAYELGRTERSLITQDKLNATSAEGLNITTSEKLVKSEKESNHAFLRRIMESKISEAKK